jgi:O-antigen/teichoic acid export membrane protein
VFVTADSAPPAAPSLTTQAVWLVTAKILGFACTFAVPLLLARVLSLVEFGLYKQAFLVVATAQAILPLGVGLSAFYFLARERERQPAVVLNILLYHVVAAVTASLAITAWPGVLTTLLGDASLVPHAPLMGLVILLWVPSSFLETVATAHQEVRLSTIFIVAAQMTRGVAMILATLWFGSIAALLYAAVLQGVVQLIILVWYLRSRFGRFWREFDWPLMRTQMAYAMPFGLAGLIYTLQTDLHQYVVANAFGAAAFAIYAVGCFQLPVTALLRDAVGSVMVPRVTRLQQTHDRSEITRLIVRVMRKLSFIYLPLYAFLVVIGPVFIEALFTSRFAASWPIFLVNLTLLPLAIVVNDPVLRAYPEHRHFLLNLRLATLGLLLIALPPAVVRFGMVGAIAAVVMTVAIERTISTWRVARILGVRRDELRPLIDVGRIAAAAATAALPSAWLRLALPGYDALVVLAACASAYFAFYIGALILLKVPNVDEAELAQRQWARVRRRLPFAAQPS